MMASKQLPPQNFAYTHLWYSAADGTTHIAECTIKGFEFQPYALAGQWVKLLTQQLGHSPIVDVVFTELQPGFDNPWHTAPSVQLVVTLSGMWYVKTSDGTRRDFSAGQVLFQDNCRVMAPVDAKQPEHYSGNDGQEACRQMIVQLDMAPKPDTPGWFGG